MKSIAKFGLAALVVATMFLSCKKRETLSDAEGKVTEESIPSNSKSSDSLSAPIPNATEKRKFIRTADIKFKVKDVAKSTNAIENTTAKFGGFVAYTNLQSVISKQEKTKISRDSTLETTKYKVENNITIRVPNAKLDTVVKAIAAQIDFLDSRLIKADDVSMQLLSNKLAQNRNTEHGKRIEKAIDGKGKKLTSIIDAEENLASKKEQSDAKMIENLSLADQVNFSTLTLQIYQPETAKQEIVANEKDIDAYRSHIGIQILDSLKTGWYMLESIIAFVAQLWSLILIVLIALLVYKRFKKVKVSF
jgi:hypothetical protein